MENIILLVWVCVLMFRYLRMRFKIGYYEQKLDNRGVEIDNVRKMSWWKLWINYKGLNYNG